MFTSIGKIVLALACFWFVVEGFSGFSDYINKVRLHVIRPSSGEPPSSLGLTRQDQVPQRSSCRGLKPFTSSDSSDGSVEVC